MPRTRRKPAPPAPELAGLAPSEVVVVGIDPGLNGGLAILWGSRCVLKLPMPLITFCGDKWVNAAVLTNLLDQASPNPDLPVHAFVERAHGFTGDSSGGAFRFGSAYGAVVAAVAHVFHQDAIHSVSPREWQRALLPGVKGRDNLKAASVARVRRIWPHADLFPGRRTTPHDGVADAMNLASYGQALLCGTLAAFDHPPEPTVRQRHRTR